MLFKRDRWMPSRVVCCIVFKRVICILIKVLYCSGALYDVQEGCMVEKNGGNRGPLNVIDSKPPEWRPTAMPTACANNRAPLCGTVPSGRILNDGTVPSGLHFNLFLFV